jgi:hypothetical protein
VGGVRASEASLEDRSGTLSSDGVVLSRPLESVQKPWDVQTKDLLWEVVFLFMVLVVLLSWRLSDIQ